MLPIIAEAGEAIADPGDRAAYYTACIEYLAFGREPESMPASLAPVWVFARDALEHSRNKAMAGSLGGKAGARQDEGKAEANDKQTGSKREANAKQTGSKREANAKQTASKPEADAKQAESKPEANAKPVSVTGTEDLTPPNARAREGAPPVPPTVEEVRAYAFSCGFPDVDPQRFIDHYASLGWMSGNTPIRDWKPKLRSWGLDDREKRARMKARPEKPRAPEDLAKYR